MLTFRHVMRYTSLIATLSYVYPRNYFTLAHSKASQCLLVHIYFETA